MTTNITNDYDNCKKIPAPLQMQGLYRKKFRAYRGLAPLINLKNLKA